MPRVRNITHNGVTMSVSAWARHTGLLPSTIAKRIDSGWSVEQALTIKQRWTHPLAPRAQGNVDLRKAVRQFADEQRRAIDAFEEDMLDRLKGVPMTPPGAGLKLSETPS